MKRIFLTAFLSVLLFSCANKHKGEQKTSLLSNFISISDNEDKGVKEVLNFYGGVCEYSIGTSISTDEGKKKFFELKLSKSDILNKYSNLPDMSASNIAYLFYKNLKGENNNYQEIHSVLLFGNGKKYTGTYSREQLELVSAKIQIANEVVALIKAKNFEGLKPLLSNDSYNDTTKSDLIAALKKVDTNFGNVQGFLLFGFRFETLNGSNVLNILGAIMRDKQNNPISLKVDLDPSDNKIDYFDYRFPDN